MDPAETLRPGSPGAPLWDPDAIPAATVVVLRDAPAGPEVLMLRRDRNLSFAGGMWVFPGGRIDHDDRSARGAPAEDDMEAAARRAAVRETAEEAGLRLDPEQLRRWSHWTPPPVAPKRYSTAFFVAEAPAMSPEVVVDDAEIREHRWARPTEMLERRDLGEVSLTPPTFITLCQLTGHGDVAAVLAAAERRGEPEHFATRVTALGDEIVALYHGDAGYESDDPAVDGPRHRLVMGAAWTYERSP